MVNSTASQTHLYHIYLTLGSNFKHNYKISGAYGKQSGITNRLRRNDDSDRIAGFFGVLASSTFAISIDKYAPRRKLSKITK